MKDYFKQPTAAFRAPELKIKASKFIGEVIPAKSRGEVETALASLRKASYDANHHCFAFRLGPDGTDTRAADDGEPNGTAGKPILSAIHASELTNILVVVTRYFGGTKLGTGPLAKAYGDAANLALTGAGSETVFLTDTLEVRVEYDDISSFERMVQRYEAVKIDQEYTETATTQIAVRRSQVDAFCLELQDSLHGRAIVSKR